MYSILENKYIHNLLQNLLSLGRKKAIKITEQHILENCHGKVLDIGCGTKRYAHLFGNNYIGIDLNLNYLVSGNQNIQKFVCSNAASLPFKDNTFDTVFSIGFFHHINAKAAEKVLQEIIRICKQDATILIIDALYPDSKLDIVGYILGKLDRGRYFRKKEDFIKELGYYFKSIRYIHIDYSYPYNLYAFIIKSASVKVISK